MKPDQSIAHDVEMVQSIAGIPLILQMVALTTGLRFAAIARVTDKNWIACAVQDSLDFGLKTGDQLALENTICNEIRQHNQPVYFDHASADPKVSSHPVPKLYGFESYISVPIVLPNDRFFGTLCALDRLPGKVDDPKVVRTLELLARLVATRIDIQERLQQTGNALLEVSEQAKLREQFVAVLGHDLRNPVQAIMMCTDVLSENASNARERDVLDNIRRSCERVTELIHNTLDFAKGRLGGGMTVVMTRCSDLSRALKHVVDEVQRAHQNRVIEVSIALDGDVICDGARVAQLLGNLVSNAIQHGSSIRPIKVLIRCDGDTFELSVENGGNPIPAAEIERLFQPFTRSQSEQTGLGLGLYIAAEIARAHDGTIRVSSDETATRFIFVMPNRLDEIPDTFIEAPAQPVVPISTAAA